MPFHGSLPRTPLTDLSTPRCADAADRAALARELHALGNALQRDRSHRELQSDRAGYELQPAAGECARMRRLALVRAAIDAYDAGQATLAATREADGADLGAVYAQDTAELLGAA